MKTLSCWEVVSKGFFGSQNVNVVIIRKKSLKCRSTSYKTNHVSSLRVKMYNSEPQRNVIPTIYKQTISLWFHIASESCHTKQLNMILALGNGHKYINIYVTIFSRKADIPIQKWHLTHQQQVTHSSGNSSVNLFKFQELVMNSNNWDQGSTILIIQNS